MTSRSLVSLHPIGIIRSPHQLPSGTPIQPAFARDATGTVQLDPEFEPALDDIEGFERIWLLYFFHRAGTFQSRVVPYRDDQEHGLFATRAPVRPNPIGMSVVRLISRDGATLCVAGLDVLDGTPLLDLKPYVPAFDAHPRSRAGWFDAAGGVREVADDRFHR